MYAKLISETSIDRNVPHKATIGNRIVVGQLPADYLASLGFFPLDESPAPTPKDGYHAESRYAYDDAENPSRILQTWVEVENPPPPPRSLSKRRLYDALNSLGLWNQTQEYMETTGSWMVFTLATTLDEDDPLIVQAIAALKVSLGLTDEQVESIISASVAE